MRRQFLSLVFICAVVGQLTPLAGQASLVILARHAEKTAPSGDPELTLAGEIRARDLATALTAVPLAAIITTQYRRTQLTAAPTAQAQGLSPTVIAAARDLPAHAAAVARAIDSLAPGSAVLVIGHSNTLGPIIAALGGPQVADLCDEEFSTLLVLERPTGRQSAPRLLRARFGVAEPPATGACTRM